jgi:hypothetical protein
MNPKKRKAVQHTATSNTLAAISTIQMTVFDNLMLKSYKVKVMFAN